MKRRLLSTTALAGVFAMASSHAPLQAQDTEIGVTAAVNPLASGTPPTQDQRVLAVGTNVFSQERVVTGESGQTQMLFLDESALTIGPNSEMVLDEFIYDPDTETGSLVMNATKGVFRLVGGKISKKNDGLLKTPSATIGIRGGIVIANVAENGATSATLLFGGMSVTSGGVTKVATRPGYQITVEGEDAPPSDPAPVDPAELEASLDTLESGADQSGGTDDAPDDSDVAGSGVGAAGSDNAPGDVAPHEPLPPEELLALAKVSTGDTAEDESDTEEAQRDEATGQAEAETPVETTPIDTGPPPLTLSAQFFGGAKHASDPAFGTDDATASLNIGFAGATVSEGIFDVAIASRFTINIDTGTFIATATE